MIHRAELFCEPGYVANFFTVPIGDGRVNLKRKPRFPACLNARKRSLVSALHPAKTIVLFPIDAIDADPHGAGARAFQAPRDLWRDQRPVGPEHRAQPA